MREPAFWWRSPSWMSRLLAPFGFLYGAISGRRMLRKGHRAAIPVICVGNYSLGGAGKTPTVIALVKLLRTRRRNAGRAQPRLWWHGLPDRCAWMLEAHTAADVGDEPLLLARAGARDRVARSRGGCGCRAEGGRERGRHGRRLSKSVAAKGYLADRDRRPSRHRQRPACFRRVRCARRSPAQLGPHGCSHRLRRRRRLPASLRSAWRRAAALS